MPKRQKSYDNSAYDASGEGGSGGTNARVVNIEPDSQMASYGGNGNNRSNVDRHKVESHNEVTHR